MKKRKKKARLINNFPRKHPLHRVSLSFKGKKCHNMCGPGELSEHTTTTITATSEALIYYTGKSPL